MVDEEFNAALDDGVASDLSHEAGRPRIRKAADAFRTISEVADELHVPQHVLRFWETKFPQVRPLKRGGGRRYYRPEDVGLLRRVADLLYTQGYTIKGVQRLLRDSAPNHAAEPARQTAVELPLDQPPVPVPVLVPVIDASETMLVEEVVQTEAALGDDITPLEDEAAPSSPEPVLAEDAPAPRQPLAPEDEILRLRALLTETLVALEAMRGVLR
ncbi:MerR family transcriptional regulator [Acidocella facilis]|uniref:MerR family transcriptional regulator n=1 Tax=Acidocella facilis TaxID=525 RepID=UPI00047B5C82|nr:MerR family transcriptional regulator [Acidocella facilis]